jgi:hypothetical protein
VDIHDDLSIAALAVSLVSFVVTLFLTIRRDAVALRPMLIFTYRATGWHVDNVGNGPALDVIFTRRRGKDISTDTHVRLPALPKGAEFLLHFARRDNENRFIATYTDSDGRPFTSGSRHDVSKISKGWKAVKRPDAAAVERWWRLDDSDPPNHQEQQAS